jgi:hypothetical protein
MAFDLSSLSVRARNVLHRALGDRIDDIRGMSRQDFIAFPSCGFKTANEIQAWARAQGYDMPHGARRTKLRLKGVTERPFRVGDRIRLSKEGLTRKGSRGGGYQGTVVKLVRSSQSVRVQFDGYKTPTSLHVKYLELDRDW